MRLPVSVAVRFTLQFRIFGNKERSAFSVNNGGRGGIRTLEAFITPTRFPVARTRPNYATLPYLFWGRRGWDSNPRRLLTSPLFESGTFNHSDTSPAYSLVAKRNSAGSGVDPALRLVRPEGLEPPTFWSATKRSIQLSYGRITAHVAWPFATSSTE